MSRAALEDQNYEIIKDAILNPENNPLPAHLQEPLQRTIQAAKLLDKNPVQKNAVAILRAKYPDISRAQAYEDCRRAMRVFNSIHTFDFDWWHNWLVQNIVELIQKAKEKGDMKAWAAAHKNLLMAIGERPETELDAKLIEKHQNMFVLQVNNQTINLSQDQFAKLPPEARQLIASSLNMEIDDVQAEEIFNS